jgi:hypothetical protein
LRGFLWFGGCGFLLCLQGAFSGLPAGQWLVATLLALWTILPLRELLKPRKRQPTDAQYRNCVLVVLVFCAGFAVWGRYLGLSWLAVLGGLFVIDAFANALAAVTEWWRLSLVGHAVGLGTCGFAFPFVDQNMLGVLLGASLLLGSGTSAAILYWQLRRAPGAAIA